MGVLGGWGLSFVANVAIALIAACCYLVLLLKACRPSCAAAFVIATFSGSEGRPLAEVLAGEAEEHQAYHEGDRTGVERLL